MSAGQIPLISQEEHVARLLALPRPGEENILAYYEHRIGAIATAPRLMLLPLDDHLAHRGDGIFETIKYASGRLYQLDSHLARMRRSAEGIYLNPPCPWEAIRDIALQVAAAGKETEGSLRILMGRGPGGFGIDPYEPPVSSLYVAAYRFTQKPDAWFEKGLAGFRTTIPAKQGYLARIKNANYLPNVLMVHEARQRGMEVPFCFDEEGCLAESAVANICLIGPDGVMDVPQFTNSLPGTTVTRAMELLAGRVDSRLRRITEADILAAGEALMLGTGPDCVAISSYEGQKIGSGREGPVAALLRGLIRRDIEENGVPVPGLAG